MALEWTDQFSCGVAEVDQQHKRIVGLLNSLEDLIGQGIGSGPNVNDLLSERPRTGWWPTF